jgi:CRP/FNR family transcriptional regulator, cyclic AMP receptor protein
MTDTSVRNRQLLAATAMFQGVPDSQLDALARQARTLRLGPREALFSKGDPGDSMYLVMSGRVRVGVVSVDGREVTYALIGPGQMFGEIAILDGGPRSADATAAEPSELLVIERRDILAFIRANGDYGLRLIEMLCARLRHANELLEDTVFLSLPSRMAKQLLSLSDAVGERQSKDESVTIRMSQQAVADYMGISRESVNKVLSKWEQVGLVSLWRGQITIRSREGLSRFLVDDGR